MPCLWRDQNATRQRPKQISRWRPSQIGSGRDGSRENLGRLAPQTDNVRQPRRDTLTSATISLASCGRCPGREVPAGRSGAIRSIQLTLTPQVRASQTGVRSSRHVAFAIGVPGQPLPQIFVGQRDFRPAKRTGLTTMENPLRQTRQPATTATGWPLHLGDPAAGKPTFDGIAGSARTRRTQGTVSRCTGCCQRCSDETVGAVPRRKCRR